MKELDFFLYGGRILDVYRLRLFPGWVGISSGKFIYVEEGRPPSGIRARENKNLKGAVIAPGLIDAHMHVESSLLAPWNFAAAVLPHGTTCVLADPHEIANVAGKEGVRWFWEATQGLPLHVYLAIPSSVPPTVLPLGTPNATLSAEDVAELLRLPGAIALGELMDYRGLVKGTEKYVKEIVEAQEARCTIEGHVPDLSGTELSAYISYGVCSDHTLMTTDKIAEELTKGITVMLQEKSLSSEIIEFLRTLPDRSRCLLVTDDIPPSRLLQGHLSQVLLQAVRLGLPPEEGFAMVTARPAAYMGLRYLGAIAPGHNADFLVLDDLISFPPREVYVQGKRVAAAGEITIEFPLKVPSLPSFPPPPKHISIEACSLPTEGEIEAHVVEVLDYNSSLTGISKEHVEIQNGSPVSADIAVVGVFARTKESRSLGLIRGFGLREGAVATSFAHDTHHLLVVGRSPQDMAVAAMTVGKMGGGIAVVRDGKVLSSLQLPLYGLLADAPLEEVSLALQEIENTLRTLGVVHKKPFLFLSVLTLPVSPHYKFSDKGIVDVKNQRVIPPFPSNQ